MKKQFITAFLTITSLLLFLSSANTDIKLVSPNDTIVLRAGDDTVTVIFESLRVPFRPADYKTGDTIRFVLQDTTGGKEFLHLLAPVDTLDLRPADTVIWVSMITPADTILCKFVFQPIEPASHFIGLLRTYAVFDKSDTGSSFAFTYCDPSDSNLVSLCSEFRLDSIAGNGDESARIANLLHWVHTTVRHDGNVEVPQGYRMADLLARPPAESRGVNCGVLAEIMNEVYLAAGFKARRIICLPYDTSDVDCHSINAVWSEHVGKWLYVDPTFEGTFRNPSGEYLSIAEVREAMVHGDSLVINDNLNWNGRPHDKAAYFRYIAKNLFRFAGMSHSGPASGKQRTTMFRVNLNPNGYDTAHVGQTDTTGHYTDNAAGFWAKP